MNSLICTAEMAMRAPLGLLGRGEKAGAWVVERELGQGGMGTVYAVVHEDIGKRAALKIMHRTVLPSSQIECVLSEARVVNLVGHPNIVDIFEIGAFDDGRPYMVMERLEGVSLAARIAACRLLPDVAVTILLQICDALIATHAAGVIHRDLKSANVFLTGDDAVPRVKVLDWGIAKQMSAATGALDGLIVGTPAYLSPEQARGAVLTDRTDVYSLGVIAYELFVEQLPFEADTVREMLMKHQHAAPPLPQDLWPDIPRELQSLLLAMLDKNPERRPTALAVARRLESVRATIEARKRSIAAAALEPPTRQPRMRIARGRGYALAACAVFAVTVGAWSIRAREGDAGSLPPPLTVLTPRAVGIAAAVREVAPVHAERAKPVAAPTVAAPPPPAKRPPAGNAVHASHRHPTTHARPLISRTEPRALDPDATLEPYP